MTQPIESSLTLCVKIERSLCTRDLLGFYDICLLEVHLF